MGPILKLVQVPLDGIPSFCCVNCTAQIYVIWKLANLIPLSVSLRQTLQSLSQNRARGTSIITSLHLNTEPLTTTLWLHPASQPIPYSLHCPSIKSTHLQFGSQDAMCNHIKGSTEAETFIHLPTLTITIIPLYKVTRLVRHKFTRCLRSDSSTILF